MGSPGSGRAQKHAEEAEVVAVHRARYCELPERHCRSAAEDLGELSGCFEHYAFLRSVFQSGALGLAYGVGGEGRDGVAHQRREAAYGEPVHARTGIGKHYATGIAVACHLAAGDRHGLAAVVGDFELYDGTRRSRRQGHGRRYCRNHIGVGGEAEGSRPQQRARRAPSKQYE